MNYQHRFINAACELPLGKVVCVGRNYAEHAKELNNPIPTAPLLFIKPATAVVSLEPGFAIPDGLGECHHETEVALLIGVDLTRASIVEARKAVLGYGLGLDLTLRDIQNTLKAKGHPWEVAKSFDGACPLSAFVPADEINEPERLTLELKINDEIRQSGCVSDMITPLFELVAYITQHFTLRAGDVVLTGTPAGVGPLVKGDNLALCLDGKYQFSSGVSL